MKEGQRLNGEKRNRREKKPARNGIEDERKWGEMELRIKGNGEKRK